MVENKMDYYRDRFMVSVDGRTIVVTLKMTQELYDYLSDIKSECLGDTFAGFKWLVYFNLQSDAIMRINERELASFWFGFHEIEITDGFMVLD